MATRRYTVTRWCNANGTPLPGTGNASHGNPRNPAAPFSALTSTPSRTGIDSRCAEASTCPNAAATGAGRNESAINRPTARNDATTPTKPTPASASRTSPARARARRTSCSAPTNPGRTP